MNSGTEARLPATGSVYLKWGVAGGLVGAVLLAIVVMVATSAEGLGATVVPCAIAQAFLGLTPGSVASLAAGVFLQLVGGVVGGLIVMAITMGMKRGLLIRSVTTGLYVGLLSGFLFWLIFGLPVVLYLLPHPLIEAVAMTMPAHGMTAAEVMSEAMSMVQGMQNQIAGVFLIGYLFFGAGLGAVVGYGASRETPTPK